MSYPLKDFLLIYNSLVERAKEELAKARCELDYGIKNIKGKEKELEDYKILRVEEEERLFNKISNKKVRKDAVTDFRCELDRLKERYLDNEKAVEGMLNGSQLRRRKRLLRSLEVYIIAMLCMSLERNAMSIRKHRYLSS